MKILLIDIETSPNQAFVWGIWDQNISLDQMIASSSTLCYSAKWLGEKKMYFDSVHRSSAKKMLAGIHRMLAEADAVVTYNGRKFDLPTLNKEFAIHRMPPPAPYQQVDLLLVARSKFRFPSNKLDYVTQALGLGHKVRHPGFKLWVDCMSGDADAWRVMERYNKKDVVLLESLYRRVLPWIDRHPSHAAHDDIQSCPKCGSESFQHRGFFHTTVLKYRRYRCNDCHGWFRGNKTASTHRGERAVNISS